MKNVFLALALFCMASSVSAQFAKAAGGSIIYGTSSKYESSDGSKPTIMLYGVTFFPRYIFSQGNGNSSLSIGVPLTAALSGSVNSQTGGNLSFGVDLPLTLDYNFGLGSSADEDDGSSFGGFAGAGFGYTYSSVSDEFYIPGSVIINEQIKGSSFGPLVNVGLRAKVANMNFTLRLFGKLGLEKAKFTTFGGGLLLDF